MLDQLIDWAALLFAGIALLVSLRVQRRQPELIAKQIAEFERSGRERLGARVLVRLVRGDTWVGAHGLMRIRVDNEGPADAKDIDVQFPDGNSPIPEGEAAAKLPIPALQAGGTFDLVAAVSMDHAPPFHVLLSWRDGLGSQTRETSLS